MNEQDLHVLDKFTEHLKKSLLAAQNLALETGAREITPAHILYGLSSLKGSICKELLHKAGIDEKRLRAEITANALPIGPQTDLPNLNTSSRNIIEKAVVISADHAHKYIGAEHVLLSLISYLDSNKLNAIGLSGEKCARLKEQLTAILKSAARFGEMTDIVEESEAFESDSKKMSTLQLLATELTDPAMQTDVDPVIGRNEEIERVMHILARRRKNNPILLGDPGVGKTAIVEGLAKKIVEGNVPPSLKHKRIFSLDVGLLLAGTSFRGEFEQRLKNVLDEVRMQPDIILFIDELHTVVGAGGNGQSGSMDMANLLKPGLARGELRCIGATTHQEYRKTIEADAALERRFQAVHIEEPTPEQTVRILEGVKKNYETFHRVSIRPSAIQKAVEWSRRYIPDKFLPDKAIDLIDEASAAVKVAAPLTREEKKELQLQKKLRSVIQKKQDDVLKENYESATKQWQIEQEIRSELHAQKEKIQNASLSPVGEIEDADIARIVNRRVGIPVSQLLQTERNKLATLETDLKKAIVGQDEAVKKVSDAIRLSRLGIGNDQKPVGSFLFMGPSGIGKTELAKQIAKKLYGDEKALIKIDMSEYGESFTASKLIGAPAGYVGYKESGKLTEAVRKKPYSVVLFDEVEKAHPDIFNLFLQVLDEGYMTDATGMNIDFKNTVVIFTSNIGLDVLNQQSALGFSLADSNNEENERFNTLTEETKHKVMKELDDFFRPEFLNRMDDIIVFESLRKPHLKEIIKQHISDFEKRLEQYKIKVTLSPQASTFVIEHGFDPDKGARAVKRYLKDEVENRIADMLVRDTIRTGQRITVSVKKNELVIS